MKNESTELLADRLPELSAKDAAGARLLFDARFQHMLSLYWPGLQIEQSTHSSQGSYLHLRLGAHDEQFDLLIPDDALPSLTSIVEARDWPEALKLRCIWTVLSAEWEDITKLVERLDWTLQFARSGKDESERSDKSGLPFLVRSGKRQAKCLLRNFSTQMQKKLEDHGILNSYAGSILRRDSRLDVALLFGARRLSLVAISDLEIGDAIVLQKSGTADSDLYRARLAAGCAAGQRAYRNALWANGSATITGDKWMSAEEIIDTALPTRTDESSRESNLADVDVDVQLELQLVTMPISVLSSMQPGYVLELPVSVEDAEVCLVVSGRVIGYAQLVRVADRLAARITRLKNDTNRPVPD